MTTSRAAAPPSQRQWAYGALTILAQEKARVGETPLREFPLPQYPGIRLLIKDETVQPTGSVKHRLAASLISYALVNGHLRPDQPIVEASSGSTAVSEAYFARLLDLPFVAVIPAGTSQKKIADIERYGGRCHTVASAKDLRPTAAAVAKDIDGYFVDQFANASVATDWRRENLAAIVVAQCELIGLAPPRWLVAGAGTGGTITALGRYCRYRLPGTSVVLADPEGSAYYPAWRSGDRGITGPGSSIEGVGRPTVEPACELSVIDAAYQIANEESFAAMWLLREKTGLLAGGSTGTTIAACARIIAEMRATGQTGTIVTVAADHGDRYLDTYYDIGWLRKSGYDLGAARARLAEILSAD